MAINMMRTAAAAVALVMPLAASPAFASTVNIGGFSFDSSQYADVAKVGVRGSDVQNTGTNAPLAVDGVLPTYEGISAPKSMYFSFNSFDIVNNVGADLLLIEVGVPDQVAFSLTEEGTYFEATLAESVEQGGEMYNLYTLDLEDLGFVPGETSSDGLFVRAMKKPAEISQIAALNSAAVPLPAALPLMLGALGIGALVARRKRA